MPMQIIDSQWRGGNGLTRRPWGPEDHLAQALVQDVEVRNHGEGKAFYLPCHDAVDYLRGKSRPINPTTHPQGWWFASLTVRNCVVDGVKRLVSDNGTHNDAFYLVGFAPQKQAITFENITIRNCDGSVMPFLFQPMNLSILTLRNVVMEASVAQRRVVLKAGCRIDLLRIENCGQMTVNPPDDNPANVKRIEILNSPLVNVGGFAGKGTEIVQLAAPPPPVSPPAPAVTDLERRITALEARPPCRCGAIARVMHDALGNWLAKEGDGITP